MSTLDKLRGSRTYLAAGLLALLGVASALGYADVPPEVLDGVKATLIAAALGFLRSGVEGATKKAAE